MSDLPVIKHEYHASGNVPYKKNTEGDFPVLELSDGSRIVGKAKQSFADLRADAAGKGLIAPQAKKKNDGKDNADLSEGRGSGGAGKPAGKKG